uniref:Uncharacterized protein n=1 Tax=Periophthalmus magnuspinnatus TaxID=409849 RepID=A0A3B3ZZT2_9GOBI
PPPPPSEINPEGCDRQGALFQPINEVNHKRPPALTHTHTHPHPLSHTPPHTHSHTHTLSMNLQQFWHKLFFTVYSRLIQNVPSELWNFLRGNTHSF